MSTSKQLQDALVYAIESALRDTLPMTLAPEVVCLNDQSLTIGNIQILIRIGAGLPDSKPRPASIEGSGDSAQLPPASTEQTWQRRPA